MSENTRAMRIYQSPVVTTNKYAHHCEYRLTLFCPFSLSTHLKSKLNLVLKKHDFVVSVALDWTLCSKY